MTTIRKALDNTMPAKRAAALSDVADEHAAMAEERLAPGSRISDEDAQAAIAHGLIALWCEQRLRR